MSKHHRQPFAPSAPVPLQAAAPTPEYLRCPLCHGGRGGVGRMYGEYAPKNRVYLRCDQCGHTWTADVVVTVDVLRVDHRLPDQISTR